MFYRYSFRAVEKRKTPGSWVNPNAPVTALIGLCAQRCEQRAPLRPTRLLTLPLLRQFPLSVD